LNVTVDFDGYDNTPTIEDNKHLRRATRACGDVVFDA
jgi:hypothetical protein